MKQDLRYAHLVASPFQRSRRRKTKGEPSGGGRTGSHARARARARTHTRTRTPHTYAHPRSVARDHPLPRAPSSASSPASFSSSSSPPPPSSSSSSPSFLLFNEHQIRTVNGKHLSAHTKNHRRWCPHALSHTRKKSTVATRSVYIYLRPRARARARVSRAHFGSRSRNSVTVQRACGGAPFHDSSLLLPPAEVAAFLSR